MEEWSVRQPLMKMVSSSAARTSRPLRRNSSASDTPSLPALGGEVVEDVVAWAGVDQRSQVDVHAMTAERVDMVRARSALKSAIPVTNSVATMLPGALSAVMLSNSLS